MSDTVFKALEDRLKAVGFLGDLSWAFSERAAFSTDNSVYQITPDAVAAPRDEQDLRIVMNVLDEEPFRSIAVTARGGGTGTNGQALNRGIIIDFRRYMNRVIDINLAEGWADVEPGVVLDDLNAQLAGTGQFFAPSTSTASRCTIGGMVSTDASGKGSRIYGKTADNLVGLRMVLGAGRVLDSAEPVPLWAQKMMTAVSGACDFGRDALIAQVPQLSRRFSGLDLERARPNPSTLDWWRLAVGAEGTLGLISSIRVKLTRRPHHTQLVVLAFDRFQTVLEATPKLLVFDPSAIEVMDDWVQTLAQANGLLAGLPKPLQSDESTPPVYAFVEFVGEDLDDLDERLARCIEAASAIEGFRASHRAQDAAEIAHLWSIRSGAVGLLGAADGRRRPVSFVEDCVVPPERLAAFVADFTAILSSHGIACGMFGHADVGCLHVRPALDIDDAKDRKRYHAISDAVFDTVRAHGGIFWGEHGKGVRGDYLEEFVGPRAFQAFRQIKDAFDPRTRFNPGKLAVAQSRRYTIAETGLRSVNTFDDDPMAKAYACNGNAACLNYAAKTPMCPSFKISKQLRHSPKGRSEILRALEHARKSDKITPAMEDDAFEAMAGCLGCKSCAGSCPSHVDVPEMKSHFLSRYYSKRRRPISDDFVLLMERYSSLLSRLRWPMRLAALTPIYGQVGRALGFIDLPKPASGRPIALLRTLSAKAICELTLKNGVVLIQDPFTTLFDSRAIADVAEGLQSLGFSPILLDLEPGGKAAHVKGDRAGFTAMAKKLADAIKTASRSGMPCVGIDPALTYMLRSEYVKSGLSDVPKVWAPEEFLAERVAAGQIEGRQGGQTEITVFLHCTETALRPKAADDWRGVLSHLGIVNRIAKTGCCGMSGLFGHERRNQDWSQGLYEMSWRQPVEDAAEVASTGFSCRCQIKRFGQKRARHPLAYVAQHLSSQPS